MKRPFNKHAILDELDEIIDKAKEIQRIVEEVDDDQ
jgi:hypothetical protein